MKTRTSSSKQNIDQLPKKEDFAGENFFYRQTTHSHIGPISEIEPQNDYFEDFPKLKQTFWTISKALKAQNRFSIILTGPSSSGKSALVNSLAKELINLKPEESVTLRLIDSASLQSSPFFDSSKIFSIFRSCTNVILKEEVDLIEGEVISLEIGINEQRTKKAKPSSQQVRQIYATNELSKYQSNYTENSNGNYNNNNSENRESSKPFENPEAFSLRESSLATQRSTLLLRTKDIESIYNVGPELSRRLAQEHISNGDIIQISKTTGELRRLGRSKKFGAELDVFNSFQTFMEVPEGEIQKRVEEHNIMALDEIDRLNGSPSNFSGVFFPSSNTNSSLKEEVERNGNSDKIVKEREEIRNSVDEQIEEWMGQNRAFVRKGILVIENADLLKEKTLSVISFAMQQKFSPSVLFITNKNLIEREGRIFPFGLSSDLVLKSLIIFTEKYKEKELENIFKKKTNSLVASKFVEICRGSFNNNGGNGANENRLYYAMNIADLALTKVGFEKEKLTLEIVEEVLSGLVNFEKVEKIGKEFKNVYLDDKIVY